MVSNADRLFEVQRVYTRGDNFFAAMSLGRHRCDHIDPGHYNPSKSGSLLIGLMGHEKVSRFDCTFTGAFTGFFVHRSLFIDLRRTIDLVK